MLRSLTPAGSTRGKAKFVRDSNVTLIQIKPLEPPATTAIATTVDELTLTETVETTDDPHTVTMLELTTPKARVNMLRLHVIDSLRVGKIRDEPENLDYLKPKPFHKKPTQRKFDS